MQDTDTKYLYKCPHKFIPLGFQKISSDERKVEVIACIACESCGLFKTKILYFDRQHDYSEKDLSNTNN